jgi:hypothetical protein
VAASDDDRIAYSSGESADRLGPDARGYLDEFRVLLAEESAARGTRLRPGEARSRGRLCEEVRERPLNAFGATRFTAPLASTPLAPGAPDHAGVVRTRAGWMIDASTKPTASPRLDDGRFDEGWMHGGAGVLVGTARPAV